MMDSPARPDPEALLAHLREEEARARRGRLKIFLGMCPGVGKTFAMLREGRREQSRKTDVVVGVVETHARPETEAMLAGMTVLPRRSVEYRGTMLTEMDLEGLLARKPRLALADELAHSNAPGSRHAKRWQDVVELLDAGIDVFTTLNIQHVESRADAVRQITGAPVQETVPDSILDLADEVELVDLTAQSLLERLREGKVYLGGRAETAAKHFFQESHLTALRELALRFTAERVDRQLRSLRSVAVKSTVWRSGERLLVAVGPSPFSTQLVRWTRRLAAAQGAPWVAVHVERSARLTTEAQKLLDQNLELARELGAELVLTQGDDVAAVLVRVALERNATQIVVGKPRHGRVWQWLAGGSLVDRLIRLGGNIDIYVVPAEPGTRSRRWIELEPPVHSDWGEYGRAAAVVGLVTLTGMLAPERYYLATGMVYLLAVIALALRVGRGPVLLAGVLSALTWNYLFIPPRFTFAITKLEDAALFFTYFAVALIAGHLTAKIRAQAAAERQRERRATALFHLTRSLAEAGTMDDALFAALRQIDELFAARSTVLLAGEEGALTTHFAASFALDEAELGVARWAHQNRRPAGRFTDTLPSRAGYYLPLVRENAVVGVLGVEVEKNGELTLAQRELLDAFSRPLALIIERETLRTAAEREKILAQSEKLHRVLLDSVSHELRTPLAVITSAVENLGEVKDAALREDLIAEARTAAGRLNRLVGNLLDQTRLKSGALKPRPDWCDARDLVNAAVEAARDALAGHPLEITLPDDLPPVRADFALTEQALANLLINAGLHTPAGTPVAVTAGLESGGKRVWFTVADRGPGLTQTMRGRIFEKFQTGDATRAGGLGLGLSIVRGFVAAQGGEVVAGENPGGGAAFTLYFLHRAPEPEASA